MCIRDRDYAAGKINLTELVERTGVSLPEEVAEDLRQNDQLQQVASNMERGIQTVAIANDSPPLPITTGDVPISVTIVEGVEDNG